MFHTVFGHSKRHSCAFSSFCHFVSHFKKKQLAWYSILLSNMTNFLLSCGSYKKHSFVLLSICHFGILPLGQPYTDDINDIQLSEMTIFLVYTGSCSNAFLRILNEEHFGKTIDIKLAKKDS